MRQVFQRLSRALGSSPSGRWLFAAAITIAATLLVRLLTAKHSNQLYAPPFLGGTALVAWFSGPLPAAISAVASALTLEFYIIREADPEASLLRMATFLGTAALILLLIHKYQRSTEVLSKSEERAKLGEAALQKTLRELATVLDTAPVAIYSIDTEGYTTTWSAVAERIFGYSHEEAIRRYPPFIPEAELPDYLGMVAAVRNGESISNRERRRRKKNGDVIEVTVWATPLRAEGGKIVGAICAIADNTERKELEQQLLQSQKQEAIGRLAGYVAHDFNNLLTAILGFNDILAATLGDDERLQSYAAEVQKAAERASALTSQLLAFSRRQPAQPQVVDLNEQVKQIEKMLRRIIGEDVELSTELEPELPPVRIDPGQVDQLIMNLAVNARDAMPEGGKLIISTAGADGRVVLALSDDGVGMEEETRRRIFEPFFTTKPEGKGTGLGLSIVYEIVRQNRGDISVDSEPGKGTTFRIYLPAVMDAAEAEAADHANVPEVRHSGVILLLEDEEVVRSLVREVLESQGFHVLAAGTGNEAVSRSLEHQGRIDLLLADVVLPDVPGTEVAERVLRQRPDMAVLFMSGYTELASSSLPADAKLIQKPFTSTVLRKRVAEVIEEGRRP